jgi:L-aminopeptidase/D-esterase-like protein
MTLLTVTQFGPATFNLFSPVEGLLLGTEQTSSSTSATLLIPSSSGVATYDITGSGLVFSGGLLVAGIVTSITYKVDGVTRVVGSGFTLDVADARNHPQGTYPIAIDPIWNYDASALR